MTWTTTINQKLMTERGIVHSTVQGTLAAAADPSPPLDAHNWGVFTIMIRLVAGTAPTGFQVQGSNDGGANYANLGGALGAAPVYFTIPQLAPVDVLRVVPTGGDATTNLKLDLIANRNW